MDADGGGGGDPPPLTPIRYDPVLHSGPFVVIVQSLPKDKNIGNLHPIAICKQLFLLDQSLIISSKCS